MSNAWISHDGQAAISELEPLPTWDAQRGYRTQRRFVGRTADIRAKYQALIGQGPQNLTLSEAQDGQGLQLVAEYAGIYDPATDAVRPDASNIVTEWTSEPIVLTKSVWEFPAILNYLNTLPAFNIDTDVGVNNRHLLRVYTDAVLNGETSVPDQQDPSKTLSMTPTILIAFAVTAGIPGTVFRPFLADLLRGVTSFTPNSWNLRRTRRIPLAISFTESADNVGRMLTYGSLLGEGFNSNFLRTALPTNGYWLKHPPTDHPVGDGSREVVTDFEWAERYSTFLYGNPV